MGRVLGHAITDIDERAALMAALAVLEAVQSAPRTPAVRHLRKPLKGSPHTASSKPVGHGGRDR